MSWVLSFAGVVSLVWLLQAPLEAADLPAQSPEPLPPEEAAATMKVPEGFSVTLFAGEPDIRQPVALAFDDRGRLWVAEAYSYPDHGEAPREDRILVFEDVDGDGRFDERRVFYDRLNYVTGLEVGFGGVWVMSPPYFFFIPDRDGDDVPDSEPELLLDGFGNHANAHNLANGFAWGPDGWLYGTHGRTNWSMIGVPGSQEPERKRFDGGVWRYHPVRQVWEPFADGCTNPWGIDWDDWGQAFIPNTVNPHLFHAIQGAHYEPWRNRESSRYAYRRIETIADHLHFLGGKNIRAGLGSEAEMALGGGHSHCGILVYLGDNFPEPFRNTVFLHNTHGRRINQDILRRRGSGYVATHAPDLVEVEDPWFMGVNFRTAPDGSVYFTDWSDTGECHSVRNTRRETGRLYRLAYGEPETRLVNLAKLDDQALVALQLHRNDWYVRHARRLLQERASQDADLTGAHQALRAILEDNPDVTRKLRALWSLWVSGGIGDEELLGLLEHENEHLRAWAIRLLGEDRQLPPSAMGRLIRLAGEGDSALVRLHIASLMQRLEPATRWALAEALLGREDDVDDPNLPLMTWYATEPLVQLNAERFADLLPRTASEEVRGFVARRIASRPHPGKALEKVLAELAKDPSQELFAGLIAGLEGRDDLDLPSNWPEVIDRLIDEPGWALPVLELGALFGDPQTPRRLQLIATDEGVDPAERRRALGRLAKGEVAADLAEWMMDRLDDPVLQGEALRGLAAFDHEKIPDRILARYPELDDLAARRDAVQTLATRVPWAHQLLDAVESGFVPRGDLTSFTTRHIQSLGDEALSERVVSLWGVVQETPAQLRKQIERRVKSLARDLDEADLPAGRLLYQQRCAACHRLFGEGGEIGPDLTGGQRSSVEYLVENIVAPSSSVANDYLMRIVELEDGRVLTGFFSAETETTVTLRSLNESLTLARSQIRKETTSPLSIMPQGLLEGLSEQQIRDLVGYLQSPRQVSLPEASR